MKHKILRAFLIIALCLVFSSITAGYAHADAIMFPWVIKTQTVSTIISVVNTAQGSPNLDDTLHFQYWYKVPYPYTDDVNHPENVCVEYDFLGTISENDIVSFDASGIINGGLPLWNDDDPLHPNDPIFASDFALPFDDPVMAYLMVDNNTESFVNEGTNVDGTLYGEALIIDVQSGTLWGYTAYNSRYTETATDFNDQVYFDDGKDFQGEVIDEAEHGWTVVLPPSEYETRFLVTPVTQIGQRNRKNLNARILFTADRSGNVGGIYQNDETRISFYNPLNVVCTAALKLEDMMNQAAYLHFNATGNQGWAYVKTLYGTATQELTDEAVIGKLERNDVLVYDGCQECKDTCMSDCKVPQFNRKSPLICDRMCAKRCMNICKFQRPITISPDNFAWIRSSDSILDYFYPAADLIIESIEIVWDYPDDVDLVITVKNQGGPTSNSLSAEGRSNGSLGEFSAIIKWKSGIEEEFTNVLCEETIPALSENETYEFSCHDVVPAAYIREYLIVADNLNWIDESNEENNTDTEVVINY